jgi:hypothetical protein
MSLTRSSLIAFTCLATLAGCGQKPEAPRSAAVTPSSARPAAQNAGGATPAVTPATRPAQETAFIRECLAVGLRPTILLDLESKALAEAQGQAKASGPTKAQLKDLRDSFSASAAKLNEMAASPAAGRKAPLAQLLADTRAKQAANCSRLPDELLHREGVGLMMLEFAKITAQAPNHQEADRRAGEHFKQNLQNLVNLPPQQKAALQEILETEQQLQQVIAKLNKDAELQSFQKAAIADVIKELVTRAQKAAAGLTPERFYETLIGHQFRPNAGRLEAGEMVKLVIEEQKIIGHCIVSTIHLDLRGNRSGQTASLKLSVVHKTYADGRPVRLQIVKN